MFVVHEISVDEVPLPSGPSHHMNFQPIDNKDEKPTSARHLVMIISCSGITDSGIP